MHCNNSALDSCGDYVDQDIVFHSIDLNLEIRPHVLHRYSLNTHTMREHIKEFFPYAVLTDYALIKKYNYSHTDNRIRMVVRDCPRSTMAVGFMRMRKNEVGYANSGNFAKFIVPTALLIVSVLVNISISLDPSFLSIRVFEVLQIIGGLCFIPGYISQIYTLVKNKNSSNINSLYSLLVALGCGFMEGYAIRQAKVALEFLITNTLCLLFSIIFHLLVIVYKPEPL